MSRRPGPVVILAMMPIDIDLGCGDPLKSDVAWFGGHHRTDRVVVFHAGGRPARTVPRVCFYRVRAFPIIGNAAGGPGVHRESQEYAPSESDDLDVEATKYATAWAISGAKQRQFLRDDLICRLVPFADRLASRYRARTEFHDDIRQAACLGLVKAVDRFDPQRGSFTAFAVVTITGEMKRHIRDTAWRARVNRGLQELSAQVGQASVELTQTLRRTPTVPEVARCLGIGEQEVNHARLCLAVRNPVSLSTPVGEAGSRQLSEFIGSPDKALENIADRVALKQVMPGLPPDIQRMIVMRFYGNLTQAQIGAEFGFSQMHVSRLLRRALAWLRVAMLSDALPHWNHVDQYQCPPELKARLSRTRPSPGAAADGAIDAPTTVRQS